jgi:hypothetical protein
MPWCFCVDQALLLSLQGAQLRGGYYTNPRPSEDALGVILKSWAASAWLSSILGHLMAT